MEDYIEGFICSRKEKPSYVENKSLLFIWLFKMPIKFRFTFLMVFAVY